MTATSAAGTGPEIAAMRPESLAPQPGYRTFHIVAMIFVTSLLVANTIAVKVIQAGPFTLPAGIIVFPVAYVFGDLLVEVWGFRRARSIIWTGFVCLALMAVFYYVATLLTPAAFWTDQEAFGRLFGFVPRIVVASFIAYLIGELLNAAILSKLKVMTGGRHFWLRCVASTLVGQGADSLVFNFIAFSFVFPFSDVAFIAFSGWVLKSLYEVLVLPITYVVAARLKRIEGIDVYDHGVRYSPLPKA